MARLPLISVVDDDDSVRESLSGLIRSVGFGVMVFSSAEEFLHSQCRRATDCLILDVRMPGINGFELQRQLAAEHVAVPVIFITAHGDEETRARALNGGAVEYLLKPFSEEALLGAIDMALKADDSESKLVKQN
jgi:FixJ family two-component response regulator